MSTEAPVTLAGWLRTRSDEQLAALLAARPDVARPAPSDLVALASRLAVPVSVDRALDELDAATLQVLAEREFSGHLQVRLLPVPLGAGSGTA